MLAFSLCTLHSMAEPFQDYTGVESVEVELFKYPQILQEVEEQLDLGQQPFTSGRDRA